MSASKIITAENDLLANVHPGEILREDFLIGSEIAVAEVCEKTGVGADELTALIAGKTAVTAETDLRLGAYFGMSKGFFLRLQNAFDLEEVQRATGSEISRIRPRTQQAA